MVNHSIFFTCSHYYHPLWQIINISPQKKRYQYWCHQVTKIKSPPPPTMLMINDRDDDDDDDDNFVIKKDWLSVFQCWPLVWSLNEKVCRKLIFKWNTNTKAKWYIRNRKVFEERSQIFFCFKFCWQFSFFSILFSKIEWSFFCLVVEKQRQNLPTIFLLSHSPSSFLFFQYGNDQFQKKRKKNHWTLSNNERRIEKVF